MVMCKTEAREERGGDCFFKSFDLKLVSSKLPIHPFVDLTKQLVQPIPFHALDRRVGTLQPSIVTTTHLTIMIANVPESYLPLKA